MPALACPPSLCFFIPLDGLLLIFNLNYRIRYYSFLQLIQAVDWLLRLLWLDLELGRCSVAIMLCQCNIELLVTSPRTQTICYLHIMPLEPTLKNQRLPGTRPQEIPFLSVTLRAWPRLMKLFPVGPCQPMQIRRIFSQISIPTLSFLQIPNCSLSELMQIRLVTPSEIQLL